MPYLYENELRRRAGAFVRTLKDAGFEAKVLAYRDYTAKVEVAAGPRTFGSANLYYSPKRRRFSLKLHEVKDPAANAAIEQWWEGEAAAAGDALTRLLEAPDAVDGIAHHAYVDGSCLGQRVGYGAVVLRGGEVIAELAGPVEGAATRQVAGEMQAVLEVLAWCRIQAVEAIVIFHDYDGLAKWVTGAWQARHETTQDYVAQVRQSGVRVVWRKVAAHTGDEWNERADVLAKEGAQGVQR